jgi:hypothetical protein
VEFEFRWEINGQDVPGEVRSELPAALLKPGDRVTVWISPYDGKVWGEEVGSGPVEIRDTAPSIAGIELAPRPCFPGDTLRVQTSVRVFGESRVSLRYVWYLNGEEVEGASEKEFSTRGFKRGDRILVKVFPGSSAGDGEVGASEEVVLQNRPPKIVSRPPQKLADPGRYRYAVRAEDPDGDRLSFRLEGRVPPGMRIDPQSGVLEWSFSEAPRESVQVDIRVSDGQGGEARQNYDFTIPGAESS